MAHFKMCHIVQYEKELVEFPWGKLFQTLGCLRTYPVVEGQDVRLDEFKGVAAIKAASQELMFAHFVLVIVEKRARAINNPGDFMDIPSSSAFSPQTAIPFRT